MLALIDCNNFYVSCERVFNPDLNGKPVVVLSNNDGCIISRSNEAKALGIPMAAPAFKFEKLFEEKRVKVFSANFRLYGDMSGRVMDMLSSFCPKIEIYSIDEAFLDFEGFGPRNLERYGKEMHRKVVKSTGLPISIGFAKTKTLAKAANRVAKKFPDETGNVYVIDSGEKREKALKWLAVGDIWGIGPNHAKRLKNAGINTAYDFTEKLSDDWIRQKLSVMGLRLKEELLGRKAIGLEHPGSKKSIATTRTFERPYTTFEELKERVITFTVISAEKLRKQNENCALLTLFLKTDKYRTDMPQSRKMITYPLPFPSDSSFDLVKIAIEALRVVFEEGFHYKKAGVILSGFSPKDRQQLALFDNCDPRHNPLMGALDSINRRYGSQKIRFSGQNLKRVWKMRQERLSPGYTSNLNEIITINSG